MKKRFKNKREKDKGIFTADRTVPMKSFHVQLVEKEWKVTSFYISNATVWCIKNVTEYEIALAWQWILFYFDSTDDVEGNRDVTLDGDIIEKATKVLASGRYVISSQGGVQEDPLQK